TKSLFDSSELFEIGAKRCRPTFSLARENSAKTSEPRHGPELAGRVCQTNVAQLAVGCSLLATKEKVLLALEPRVVMAAMHTTMIRANMTAYSTAVGPSSFLRNETNFLVRLRISSASTGTENRESGELENRRPGEDRRGCLRSAIDGSVSSPCVGS